MHKMALIVSVRLLDGRYHGGGVWPPSPFRLFQALVAAAHAGRDISQMEINAFRWLEGLAPPIIITPKAKQSQTTTYFVPRNGADADGGDLAKAAKKRDAKLYRPWLFNEEAPFVYIWFFESEELGHAEIIINIAEQLYQLGRGIDMAFAYAESTDAAAAEQLIAEHTGSIHRPTPKGAQQTLPCPKELMSFNSLITRHKAQLGRVKNDEFYQVPQPMFELLGYDCPTNKLLFDIVENSANMLLSAQPLTKIAKLVENIRDKAAERLMSHWPKAEIERCILGLMAKEADKALRIRIIPLPSIGATQADQAIRRILVESPPDCPIATDDIAWAFSGLEVSADLDTDATYEPSSWILVKSDDRKILRAYGIETETKSRVWRTVTPAALVIDQQSAKIRPISGSEQLIHQQLLGHAAKQALRHAGLHTKAEIRKIQPEPLDQQSLQADEFAYGRFPASGLFHLEIAFSQPIAGPVLLGNGRYFGLGLMRPMPDMQEDVLVLEISAKNRPKLHERNLFLTAVRRALLACARDYQGSPSRLFSGHEADGAPARSGRHEHVFLAADDSDGDGLIDHLLLVAPWRADRTHQTQEDEPTAFAQTSAQLEYIRAGKLGVFQLSKTLNSLAEKRLLPHAKQWHSVTLYEPTRYPKSIADAQQKLHTDILLECQRRGLPKPNVEIVSIIEGKRGGFRAEAKLDFAVAVAGPLMLGRESHKGGGLFYAKN